MKAGGASLSAGPVGVGGLRGARRRPGHREGAVLAAWAMGAGLLFESVEEVFPGDGGHGLGAGVAVGAYDHGGVFDLFDAGGFDDVEDVKASHGGVAHLPLQMGALLFDFGGDLFGEVGELCRVAHGVGADTAEDDIGGHGRTPFFAGRIQLGCWTL